MPRNPCGVGCNIDSRTESEVKEEEESVMVALTRIQKLCGVGIAFTSTTRRVK